jgi:thiamine biosynthesis lipoprotein
MLALSHAIVLWVTTCRQEAGPADGAGLVRFEFRETHMGSEFKLVLYTKEEASARRASKLVFDRVAELDRKLSDYDPESELMRLCDRAGDQPVPVSDDLFRVLARAQEISRRTNGAFDVTVNPVVRLWRRARRERRLPDPEALEKARALVGYRNVLLDDRNRTVQLAKPGMKLDLGGIAKGFASDEAIQLLKGQGIDRALVGADGDIVVSGPPPGTRGWTIAIAALDPKEAETRFLRLHDCAVSTAGDAERYVEIGGVRYSHIVNPKTGLGMIERASVTVVAADGATADSLDTATYVLGPEEGLPIIDATAGAAGLFLRLRDGRVRSFESARWRDVASNRD